MAEGGSDLGRVLVTGANGHLGRRTLARIAALGAQARAVVRSERAAAVVRELPEKVEVAVLDYADVDALADAARGCDAAVHYVGILKEGARSRYADAHEGTCRALAEAAARAGLRRIVYPSILGARPDSPNACLASKGRAERILLEGAVPAVILRVPMVLGPGDDASRALLRQATAGRVFAVRGGASLEQPIDAEDVVSAVIAALSRPGLEGAALDLAGPESLPRRELLARVAALHGRSLRVRAVPRPLVDAAAAVLERVSQDPPITRAMLGVLEHDDAIDPLPSCERLGIALTPLDETLRRVLGPECA